MGQLATTSLATHHGEITHNQPVPADAANVHIVTDLLHISNHSGLTAYSIFILSTIRRDLDLANNFSFRRNTTLLSQKVLEGKTDWEARQEAMKQHELICRSVFSEFDSKTYTLRLS